ncbi:helix-turn-helix domain-containing protein [Bacillus sp. ISL-75]|uniref:helix-turn-helix domain-containing protein n=1 Tax=Bacillus sp. ISL-75 TaxID=2819137 RepID=UPI001BEB1614|nr:helix-turn-helix domain-containing protein [Bacillus sp. ISL-75]MBT2727485.1 helix-turn-helix domain-containing protein [Bacillus sp. ISL-75]
MTENSTPRHLENKESFIHVPKLFRYDDYTEFEIFLYAVIEGLSRNPIGATQIGVNQLIALMGMYENTKLKSKVKGTLESLRKLELIEIYEDNLLTKKVEKIKPANSYFIRTKEKEREIGFTKVFYEDFYKILTLDNKYKMKIFSVYFEIMSYIYYTNSNSRVAYPNIDTIAKATGIDRKSIMKYSKILMENEILICLTVSIGKKNKNFYARWIHKEEIVQQIKHEAKNDGGIIKPVWEQNEAA